VQIHTVLCVPGQLMQISNILKISFIATLYAVKPYILVIILVKVFDGLLVIIIQSYRVPYFITSGLSHNLTLLAHIDIISNNKTE